MAALLTTSNAIFTITGNLCQVTRNIENKFDFYSKQILNNIFYLEFYI
jgi:hypothetical protein